MCCVSTLEAIRKVAILDPDRRKLRNLIKIHPKFPGDSCLGPNDRPVGPCELLRSGFERALNCRLRCARSGSCRRCIKSQNALNKRENPLSEESSWTRAWGMGLDPRRAGCQQIWMKSRGASIDVGQGGLGKFSVTMWMTLASSSCKYWIHMTILIQCDEVCPDVVSGRVRLARSLQLSRIAKRTRELPFT